MIEIIVDKERNLKNLKQVGTPLEENKIYVENLAYCKLKEEGYKEKRVFVLMGHTERMNGKYATFVDAVVYVAGMEFYGTIPRWNSKIWSDVFREIKRIYEEMIIVGWALDVKGMAPKMNLELERIHREHFGGMHQLLLLMDSLEGEETFYSYRENKLTSQEGFYIYYRSKVVKSTEEMQRAQTVNLALEIPKRRELDYLKNTSKNIIEPGAVVEKGGQYRELLREKQIKKGADSSNAGIAVAVALLMFVIGVGAYENKDRIWGNEDVNAVEEAGYLEGADTEHTTEASEVNAEEATTNITEAGYTIPVERISGEISEEEEKKDE